MHEEVLGTEQVVKRRARLMQDYMYVYLHDPPMMF
jgi:hypothetical protein